MVNRSLILLVGMMFVFSLVSMVYAQTLEIKCDEKSSSQTLFVSVPGLKMIEIKDVVQEKNLLRVNYDFDGAYVIGDEVLLDMWVVDDANVEINRVQDMFNVRGEGIIEREIVIDIGKSVGVYYVYFALNSDLDNFVKQSVILGNSRTIGQVVLDTFKGKMIGYVAFLVMIAIALFFIIRRHGSPVAKGRKGEKAKNKWLLRHGKKGWFG
jgi:hypothetical protein